MHGHARHRPGFRRLALATAAVSLLAVIAAVVASAGSSARSAPLPPGSLALALDAPPGVAGATPGAAVAGATPAANGSICYYGACYNYVAGRQYAYYATGASVQLWRALPLLARSDPNAHSLEELAVQSSDGLQIVEVGWTVDYSLNGDILPHLFVYHWVDGVPTCYNGCGFVQTSTKVVPGERLLPLGFSTFQINHVGDEWQISLDGTMFGYFPDSLWGSSTFTQPLLIQTFGEVASTTSTPTCDRMGTGWFAESPLSASIKNFTLLGPTVSSTNLFAPGYELVTTPQWYDDSYLSPTGFRLGGPGPLALCLP